MKLSIRENINGLDNINIDKFLDKMESKRLYIINAPGESNKITRAVKLFNTLYDTDEDFLKFVQKVEKARGNVPIYTDSEGAPFIYALKAMGIKDLRF